MVPAPSGEHADIEAQLLALLRAPAAAAELTVTGQFNLGESDHDYRVPDGGLHRRCRHLARTPLRGRRELA